MLSTFVHCIHLQEDCLPPAISHFRAGLSKLFSNLSHRLSSLLSPIHSTQTPPDWSPINLNFSFHSPFLKLSMPQTGIHIPPPSSQPKGLSHLSTEHMIRLLMHPKPTSLTPHPTPLFICCSSPRICFPIFSPYKNYSCLSRLNSNPTSSIKCPNIPAQRDFSLWIPPAPFLSRHDLCI